MVNETEVRGGVRSGGILGERESLEQQREEHARGETCPREGPSAPPFPDIPQPPLPYFPHHAPACIQNHWLGIRLLAQAHPEFSPLPSLRKEKCLLNDLQGDTPSMVTPAGGKMPGGQSVSPLVGSQALLESLRPGLQEANLALYWHRCYPSGT